MARTIVIRITVDNREAINSIKAQRESLKMLHDEIRLTNEQQRAAELHALRVAKANETLETSQKSLIASIAQGYIIGKAVSAIYTSIAGSLGQAAANAVDFQFQMAKINAITGAGSATLAALETTIRNVSAATSLSQNELAKTALEMSKLGLSSRQVQEALVGVAQLSRALDEDLVATGETVVAILNTYNFNASEAGRVTDQLAFTVKASALDIQKFGTAFAYVGGTAAAAGVSFEELQGAMDILSNAGIKSSTIGTQLRRIIADLSNENSKASQAIGGQTIQTVGLVGALEALRDKNIDISGLTEIFGRTASSVASILIKYSSAVGGLADETSKAKGLTKDLSDLMQNNLKTNLDATTTAWTDLGIEISKSTGFLSTFLGIATKALRNGAEVISDDKLLSQFEKENPKEFARAKEEVSGRIASQGLLGTTDGFKKFKRLKEMERAEQEQKENLVDELKNTFQQDFILPKGFNPKTDLGKIPIEDTRAFQNLQALYGSDDPVFAKALAKAQLEFSLKLEHYNDSEFDNKTLDKAKKAKKAKGLNSASKRMLEYRDLLSPLSQENQDFVPLDDRIEKPTKLNEASKGMIAFRDSLAPLSDENQAEEFAEHWSRAMQQYIDYLGEAQNANEEFSQGLYFTMETFDFLGASANVFGDFVANQFRTNKETLTEFKDAFGEMALSFISQIIAMEVRLLAFKAAVSLFKFATGAFAGEAAVNAIDQVPLTGMTAANGYDGVLSQPTMILAGEAGPERVKISPLGKTSSMDGGGYGGGGNTIIYVTGDVFNAEKLVDKVQLTNERSKQRYV